MDHQPSEAKNEDAQYPAPNYILPAHVTLHATFPDLENCRKKYSVQADLAAHFTLHGQWRGVSIKR